MKFSDIKIAKRLAIGFGILFGLLILSQVMGLSMLTQVSANAERLGERRIPNITATNAVLVEVNDIAIALRNMMLDADPADRQKQREEIAASGRAAQEQLTQLSSQLTNPDARVIFDRMTAAHDKYVLGQQALLKHIDSGDDNGARDYLKSGLRPVLAELKSAINEQVALQQKLARDAVAETRATDTATRRMVAVVSTISLLLAVFVAWIITRSITRPLARALDVANTVAAGDLSSRIEVTSRDETGMLLQALKTMNENL
uniref:MCP four helix bundle domain-containing protein n=1 Tax=Massilia sp. TaxID=1882437 RepID=UPI0028A7A84F